MTIKAGDVWEYKGQTIEWLQDMHTGDPITTRSLLIDGETPTVQDPFPSWAHEVDSPITPAPPAGVKVVAMEGRDI